MKLPTPSQDSTPQVRAHKLRSGNISPMLLWAFVIFILGGVVIAWNYYASAKLQEEEGRPPFAYSLQQQDLSLVRRDGSSISIFEIAQQDIPWVFATFYTSCPGQCQGVIEELVWLDKQIGDKQVNFVLLSFDPEKDTPNTMRAWTNQWPELAGENWYFLTASEGMGEEIIHDYLVQPLKMSKPKWQLTAEGERDYEKEPSHPMNALVFTRKDMRGSFNLGLVPGGTPAMVRQSRNKMLETIQKLLATQDWKENPKL